MKIYSAFNAAQNGDTVLVPLGKDYYCAGGINGTNLVNITLSIQGNLIAVDNYDIWRKDNPTDPGSGYSTFLHITNSKFFTLNGGGTIDGKKTQQYTV